MSWELEWSDPARASLMRMSPTDAQRVDAAVQHLARTGEGEFIRLPDDHAVTLRLRVDPYVVRLTLDLVDGVLSVLSVYTPEEPWPFPPDPPKRA
ncbi:hypothetical protein [Sorangium sp. So ce861]|uniref:hypothetical protein n=1 Tax=Sorangium sp. So ce861 TaxID=3133323 RepID=UPI003F643F26